MPEKIAAIILDALGPYTMRQSGLEFVESLYEDDSLSSGLMCCSGLAHTPISNSMLWGGYRNNDKVWVREHPYRWTGGIGEFDPTFRRQAQVDSENIELWERHDIETNYIWDVLDYHGYEACALGIPICLPPYSFNAEYKLEKSWFPHTPEQLREHVRLKPMFIQHHALEGYDFIACSIKVPDQWLHAQGSEIIDREFIKEEAPVFEEKMKETINILEQEGYDWMIFGDHGAPIGGRTANYETRTLLSRHRKEAIIIGTLENLPRYTDQMYPLLLDYFGVEDIEELLEWPRSKDVGQNVSLDTILEISRRKEATV